MQSFPPIVSENFNGGEIFAVEPILLRPNQLQKAINVRFKLGGGFTNRPGFYALEWPHFTGLGTNGVQGLFANETEMYIGVNGKLFATPGNPIDAFQIYTGLSTAADVQMFDFQGDIYEMNGFDFPLRIARTTIDTPITAGSSAAITLKSGQAWRFSASGSVVIVSANGVETRTYGGISGDQLTSASIATFNHPIGSLIYQITSLTTAPKGGFGTEFKNTWWMAGNPGQTGQKYQGNTLFFSRTATGLNPEYFYDFAGLGAGFIPVGDKSDITGLLKTKTYLLILKKKSAYYCDGFDSNGQPNISPLTEVYGASGKRSFAIVGDQVVSFTGRSIKEVGEQEGLNNGVPSVNAQFDDKIFKKLQELTEDQSNAVVDFNSAKKLLKIWTNKGSERVCFVLDTNIQEQPWSRDTGKPASCAINFKGETYWGSNSEPKIFLDETGGSDNGVGIRSEIKLADFNAGTSRISKYFKLLYLYGLLGPNTIITVKIYFDDSLVQQFTLNDSLIKQGGGNPIGRHLIGGGAIGGGNDEVFTDGFPFDIERLLKKRINTRKMSIEFIVDGEGQVFEIKGQETNGYYLTKFDRKIRD